MIFAKVKLFTLIWLQLRLLYLLLIFAYQNLQKAFVAERTELKEQYGNKWDDMMKDRGDKEVNFMKACQKRVDDYENQLQHLRVMDAEEYCKTKIRVEKDLQVNILTPSLHC